MSPVTLFSKHFEYGRLYKQTGPVALRTFRNKITITIFVAKNLGKTNNFQMFQQVACTIELAEKFGRSYPEFSGPIRFEVEQRLPLTKLELYSFAKDGAEYFYGHRHQKHLMSDVIVTSMGDFIEGDFIAGFRLFCERVGLLEGGKMFLLCADEHFVKGIFPILEEHNWEYDVTKDLTYFISESQAALMLKSTPLSIPEGYELDSAKCSDATIITETWKYNSPGQEDHTRMKLSAFPSTCVQWNGVAVAFEMVHPNGMLNHLYVLEEHRGKGLGHAVEQDLCKKLIREGFTVYKNIEDHNTSLIKQTDASPYWTKKTKTDGTPLYRIYSAVWPKETLLQ